MNQLLQKVSEVGNVGRQKSKVRMDEKEIKALYGDLVKIHRAFKGGSSCGIQELECVIERLLPNRSNLIITKMLSLIKTVIIQAALI